MAQPEQDPVAAVAAPTSDAEAFLASLMETELYSIGAYFCDQHPDLVEDVLTRSGQIESEGLAAYAERGGLDLEETFRMLLTGLAVRYYKAVAG